MPMKYSSAKRNSFRLNLFSRLPAITAIVLGFLVIGSGIAHAQNLTDSLINQTIYYTENQEFDVPGTEWKIKIDLLGFNNMSPVGEGSKRLFNAGNAKRGMIARMEFDTLYTDLKYDLSEYRETWWYFYEQDPTNDLGKRRVWEDSSKTDVKSWSTSTVLKVHGIDIDEKRFDVFLRKGNHWFHAWITRPVYLEGDSLLMMSILNSIEILPVKSAK
ncbi:MAG: hypothetical protein IIB00_05635 [candidate division Zixibacteria bacterium]|nr:hypothetical protein [candidate division Zixibacteria bacterium]